MSSKNDIGRKLSETEIDQLVMDEIDDASAWSSPIKVHPSAPSSFSLSKELAARAAFLARLHHLGGAEEWLTRIIQERIELEENAFAEAKRDLMEKVGSQGRR